MSSEPILFGDEHARRYRETGGEVGHIWKDGAPTLLLMTTGAPEHPAWYLNLVDRPEVEVQVADEVFLARARTAEGDERERLWKLLAAIWPAYDEYQTKTDREIPIVVLERG